MKVLDHIESRTAEASGADLLSPLISSETRSAEPAGAGVVLGELLAIAGDGQTPLVTVPGRDAAIPARAGCDLHGGHIGSRVVLMFEHGNPDQPIIVGVIRDRAGWPLETKPAQVEVDADGQRLVVTAKDQLVLRCGKASITLTRAGKVLIEGAYVSSRSSGVNRVKGGSIQLN